MLIHKKLLLGVLAGVAFAAILLMLLSHDVQRVTARTEDTSVITFTCCVYSPANVTIAVGDTVTWEGSFEDHPLVSDDGLWPTQSTDTTFSHTLLNAGFYRFHCAIHGGPGGEGMSGVVLVTWPDRVYLPFVQAADLREALETNFRMTMPRQRLPEVMS